MMIRKRSAVEDPLLPAFTITLMSGGTSDPRAIAIRGRWALFGQQGEAMRGLRPDPLGEAWNTHGAALTAEAAAAGFRPHYVLAGDAWTPAEEAAELRWRDEFLRVHGVQPTTR